ncbi:MAG: bis(5'-nucleosyl)-tetraphosphatase (symmetrical) YqeK [Alkalispirochaeta sp.]
MTTSRKIHSISNDIESMLPYRVSQKRYGHIQRVVRLIEEIAARFGIDGDRARLIGLAHDMERGLPSWKSYALLSDWALEVTPLERRNPVLLHGPIASARLQRQYGVTEPAVIRAVRHHTLGSPEIDTLGLALYVADSCEPGRARPDARQRKTILSLPTLEAMVIAIIELNGIHYGPLEEPTRQLYARLKGA